MEEEKNKKKITTSMPAFADRMGKQIDTSRTAADGEVGWLARVEPDSDEEGEGLNGMYESSYIHLEQYNTSKNIPIMSLNAQSINIKFQKIRDTTHKNCPACTLCARNMGEK